MFLAPDWTTSRSDLTASLIVWSVDMFSYACLSKKRKEKKKTKRLDVRHRTFPRTRARSRSCGRWHLPRRDRITIQLRQESTRAPSTPGTCPRARSGRAWAHRAHQSRQRALRCQRGGRHRAVCISATSFISCYFLFYFALLRVFYLLDTGDIASNPFGGGLVLDRELVALTLNTGLVHKHSCVGRKT